MYTRILIAASVLLVSAGLALAQTFPLTPEPRSGVAGPPYARAPTSPAARSDPSGVNVANPSANPAPPPRGIRNPYFGEDNPYVTGTATPRRGKAAGSPAETSAQRQSGLSDADARSLLQQQGYAGVTELRAEPNSVWVWQADATKNGRRVRLGIDHRGNLLDWALLPSPAHLPVLGLAPVPSARELDCPKPVGAPIGEHIRTSLTRLLGCAARLTRHGLSMHRHPFPKQRQCHLT